MNLAGFEHSPEALLRAVQHWEARHSTTPDSPSGVLPRFTIALSREVGARSTSVGREIGLRLNWPVYDNELLQKIAEEMHVRVNLLQSVDERHVSWLQESVEAFASVPSVREAAFVRQLVETLLSLGIHGQCVIVGRGAPQVLPKPTTLRVRVIAELEDRINVMSQELRMSHRDAARYVETHERQRIAFIKDHFQKDPTDSLNYDLVLNSSTFTVTECAELAIQALHQLEAAKQRETSAPLPATA